MKNTLVIGSSDKTELLLHLIQNDFPRGVTVIDPDGRLAKAVADIVPVSLTERTFYFSSDTVGSFNVFENVQDKHKLVQDLCAFFDAMFPAGQDTLTKANSTFVLANALTILLDAPNVSFIHVLDFMSDVKFRADCLGRCTNPVAVRNWEAIEGWDKQQRSNGFAQVQSKLGTLLLSPVVRQVVQEKCSHFFEHNTVLIFNLSRATFGDTVSRLLGTLFITQATTPTYINGFGFFSSSYLATLFSRGGYTVALQFLDELEPTLQQAVLAFDDKFVFRTTPEDANRLKFGLGIQNIAQLVDLKDGDFRPALDLEVPAVTGRFRRVLKRSIACHTRRSERRLRGQ